MVIGGGVVVERGGEVVVVVSGDNEVEGGILSDVELVGGEMAGKAGAFEAKFRDSRRSFSIQE